jgi:myo-inositol 2-dehydrogenase/D-chiro-inositol 1-dehydrogenase
MNKIKFGVIGTGRIGRLHIENLCQRIPTAQVVAAADLFIDSAKDFLDEFGIVKQYKNPMDLINDPEIQAVIVASSTATHSAFSIAAAKAGKHVFCEKPIDLDLDRIKEVVLTIAETGVKLQVGFNRRWDHNFKRVREAVQSGTVGDVQLVRISSRDPAPPPVEYIKVSGGIFFDMMIHDFDMIRYICGSEVSEVYANGSCLVDPAIGQAGDVDTAMVMLKFANGAIGVIDNSRQAVYGYDQRVEVFGSKGQALAYNDKPNTVEISTAAGIFQDNIPNFFLQRYTDSFIDEFNGFIQAIVEDRPTLVDAVDGLRSVEVAIAATQSYREGRPIKLRTS